MKNKRQIKSRDFAALCNKKKGIEMIQIDDYDPPIEVAKKIITGTRKYDPAPIVKAFNAVFGTNSKEQENKKEYEIEYEDMFDLEEIKEIADYLLVYYNSHPKGD